MPSTPHLHAAAPGSVSPTHQQLQQQFQQDPVLGVIQQNLPAAFSEASPQAREDYRRALLASKTARTQLKQLLKPLKGLSEFAVPLLRNALDSRFGQGFDPQVDTLFHPVLRPNGATGSATQLTLLEAALHNFERKESVTGGFLASASIYQGMDTPHPKNIRPEQFADVCRHLNLGRKYQDHLQSVLEPESLPGDAPDAGPRNARAVFMLNDQTDMELYAQAAFLRKTIGSHALKAIQAVARQQSAPEFDGYPLLLERLSILDVEIPRVVLIKPRATWTFTQVPIVLYIPQDPVSPFKEYSSMTALEDDLRARLMDKSYQTFFAHFIGERKRAEFFARLNKHLFTLTPVDGSHFTRGLWHRTPDHSADLRLETDVIDGHLFKRMYEQQISLIKDNARFLAVPTEDEDAKSRKARLQAWFEAGMSIANLASFFVPVLGQFMMVYASVELVSEVYHGLEDLSHGDLEEGLDHLTGAAANIAFMVALAKVAHGAGGSAPPPIKSNEFVGQVIPIQLKDGTTRLWKPDLAPFQVSVEIPADAKQDLHGVFELDGKKYLTIEDRTYEVRHRQDLNKWQLQHPNPDHRFSPVLEHNEAGAFRHEGEMPEQWSRNKLFKRLGHSVSGLSETAADRILAVTGTDETLLRQLHVQNSIAPGQLRDTIKRFELDSALESFVAEADSSRAQQFDRLYSQSEISTDPAARLLCRDFPTLPISVAEELVATSLPAQAQEILTAGRVPMQLGEAAAWQVGQTRLNRAMEGFYLKSVINPDTETLSLSLLEKLPGWPDQVLLEVRKGTVRGKRLSSVGNLHAAERKILVKSAGRYQAFDADGNPLNSVPKEGNNLCDSILHALPDNARLSIGFPHVGQAADLNAALAKLAVGNRDQASRLLGQRPKTLRFNAPQRLKKGRLGYGLSGRGQLPGFVLEDHLLDKIGLLELSDTSSQAVLAGMRREGLSNADINARLDVLLDERQALRTTLDRWAEASAAIPNMSETRAAGRTWIADAILRHWQTASFAAPGGAPIVLRLESVVIPDFPAELPDFFYAQVERLQLHNTTFHTGVPVLMETDGIHYVRQLDEFLARFTQLTSLEVSRPVSSAFRFPEFYDLPRIVSTRLPQLRNLSLTNQGICITARALEYLSDLRHLETLDLSGNNFNLYDFAPGTVNLRLRRLGMDQVQLERWPEWLTQLVPEHIGEVSLVDNRIGFIPDSILNNRVESPHRTLIALRGNRLSRSDVIEARLREVGTDRPFRFDMGESFELQERIGVLLTEQAELESAIRDWVEASSSSQPLSPETLQIRRQLGVSLVDHWRSTVAGRVSRPILIASVELSAFPQRMPETFYNSVSGLLLRSVIADVDQLNLFLGRFPNLRALDMVGHVIPLEAPPKVIATLPNLMELSLVDQGMLIDQAAMDFLSGLHSVRHLDLGGNRLGSIVMSPAMGRHWESLTLDNVGLDSWPAWLDAFLPGGIDSLSLCRNQLTELPEELIRNRRNDSAHTEISLEGNPLSRETMTAAHISEYGNRRSFSFYMDLPEDIRALPPERAWSSSESTTDYDSDYDSPVHQHGPTGADTAELAGVNRWLEGPPEQVAAHQAIWNQIEAAGDAPVLLTLIGRLQETADYLRARDALVPRVWNVLEAAAQDAELRALLDGMAQEAIASRTCGDGVRLEFNQMEVQVFARNSLRNIPDSERGSTLYRLMRRFYRLDEVDRLARIKCGNRDEAEVRLAYRLRLADSLDLPLPPARMLYRTAAAVTPQELIAVQSEVLASEGGEGFLTNALSRDFWVGWLRETYASEFAELEATFKKERVRLEDEFPELNEDYLERIKVLDDQQKAQELALIRQLTHREGLKYDH